MTARRAAGADAAADGARADAAPHTDMAAAGPGGPAPDVPAGFAALGLASPLVRAAAAHGWATPTAIQAAAIPAALQGRDLLALAATGSGKTAAFLLPLVQRLTAAPGWAEERPRRLRALVLSPTRELALQTAAVLHRLAPALKAVVAVGGVSVNPQMLALRGGAHVVLATPGRLLDLTRANALRLADIELLVLDEADRLLDEGFADEIGRVLALLPPARTAQRQTLLFSATMPDAVAALAGRALRDAWRLDLTVAPPAPADAAAAGAGTVTATPSTAWQRAIEVDTAQRTPLLCHLLQREAWTRVLVFVATQYATGHVAQKLKVAGVAAAAWHGRLSAGARQQALADFKAGRLAVLVATDLAARGIDVAQLPVVVNHDLPRSAVDHTHRIGRTARAGAPGLAVSFICADAPGSEAHFRLIEKRQGLRVPRERVAGFEPQRAPADGWQVAPPADPQGGVKGRRPSKKDKLRAAAAATPGRIA